MKEFKNRLSVQIVLGLLVGLAAGAYLGPEARDLGEIGKLLIQLIKMIAAPLLFFAIVNAILTSNIQGRRGLTMIGIAMFNATLALILGLALTNFFEPGKHLNLQEMTSGAAASSVQMVDKLEFGKVLSGLIPVSFVQPFAENLIIELVLIALLLGFGILKVREDVGYSAGVRTIEDLVATALRLLEILLGWVIRLTPFAVFGIVAKTIGEYGFAPLKGLAAYLAVALGGLFLHVLIVYHAWILFYCKRTFREFWSIAKDPVIYSAGANSSLATLPLTLNALDKLKVSRSSSALGACVGTNFNNDGIILYEAMAALFIAQAHGIDLTVMQQVSVALISLVAAMGVAGVPEAGFISLSLVLTTVGLPVEFLPILLTVDWVIARARSVVNVLSDMVVSMVLDKRASG